MEIAQRFYLGLGFLVQSEDVEEGPFIDQVTGLDSNQMGEDEIPDGSLLELLQYQQSRGQKKTKQLSNEMGVACSFHSQKYAEEE